jgi:inositol 1,4,5-triphosphate receptor type 1
LTEQVERSREKEEDRQLSVKVSVMQPILRFLQLLCENHNKQLQNLLRWGISKAYLRSSCSTKERMNE